MYEFKYIKSVAKLYTAVIALDETINKQSDTIYTHISQLEDCCKSLIATDNQTNKIFGYYGLYSDTSKISEILNIPYNLIKEIIVFKYTEDTALSLIIKEMFHMTNVGNVYNPFLRKQIQAVAHSGDFTKFNMRDEYISFCHFDIYIKSKYDYSPFPQILLKDGESFDFIGYNQDGSYFMPELDKSEPDE